MRTTLVLVLFLLLGAEPAPDPAKAPAPAPWPVAQRCAGLAGQPAPQAALTEACRDQAERGAASSHRPAAPPAPLRIPRTD